MNPKPLPPVEFLRATFSYDAATGELRWRPGIGRRRCSGNVAGTPRKKREGAPVYRYVTIDHVDYPTHRLIWKIVTGEEPAGRVDHQDT